MRRIFCAPGPGVGPQQDAEQLLASPQLQGLQEGRCWQIDMILAIPHVRAKLAELSPGIGLILARQEEC